MAENNQDKFNQQNQDWDQNRNRSNRDNDFHHGSENYGSFGNTGFGEENDRNMRAGYGHNAGSSNYGQSSQQQGRDRNWQDENKFRNSGYGGSQYGGASGSSFGQSGSEVFGSTGNVGGSYGGGQYGNQHRNEDDWNRHNQWNQSNQSHMGQRGGQQDWNRSNMNYGSGSSGRQDYGQSPYRSGNQYNQWGGSNDQNRGEDRGWWEKAKDKVSSFFDNNDDDYNRSRGDMNRQRLMGGHRGKGPKEYQRSSERIREDIYDRLSDDDHVDATHISVQVTGNEVVLTGTVSSREEKRHAEDLVESISGVRHVENRIRVERNDNNSSMFQRTGNSDSAAIRAEGLSDREYTGNTDNTGGIGNESGTTNEVIRNANKDRNK
jgi:osmotically-inducible protein OsmY